MSKSTERLEQATSPEAAAEKQRDGLAQLRTIIDTMVPPRSVTVVDVLGNEHRLPGAVSARVQVEILRIVESLASLPAGALLSGTEQNARGALSLLLTLAHEPRVLDALSEAFGIAHPGAVERARAAVQAEGGTARDAADVFAVEEIVAGLVPLFVRLVKRGTSAAEAVGVRGADPARG